MRFQRMLIQDRDLPALVRPFGRVLVATCLLLCAMPRLAWAAPAATTTALAVTSRGNTVATVAPGSVVALTATVTAGSTPVTPGQINFCDATAKSCTDIHLLGTAQLTSNGTATLKFRPGIGGHSYQAVFLGTNANAKSSSAPSALAVATTTGLFPTATTLEFVQQSSQNIFRFAANVRGRGPEPPTGTVSFMDTSNSNIVLATAPLTPGPAGMSFESLDMFVEAPGIIASGDFNGDGLPDLAVGSAFGNDIQIFLGNGDGTFTAGANYQANVVIATSMVVGDFNGDGKTDLAVVGGGGTVLLGNGDGTFTPAANLPAVQGPGAQTVATGDFNGDGNADLAVTIQNSSTVAILLGNGDGSFTVGPTMTTGGSATNVTSVAVGDFNADGKLDLAVTNCKSNTVTILLGNGDGSFTAAPSPATGPVPSSIVAADLNGDGKLDLAVTTSNDATILLGNGDGTFTSAASPAMSQGSLAAIGDFNGDGIPDLAVAGGVAGILLGNGDGTFTAGASPQNANEAESLAVADFDGDGLTDLAVSILAGDADTVAALLAETQWATAEADNISPSSQGTHRIGASYGGDSNYSGSPSTTIPISISPGFAVSTSSINSISPGGSGTSTITVTATGGFTGSLTLSCSVVGINSNAPNTVATPTCSVPAFLAVPGTGAATATLTVNTQVATIAGIYLVNLEVLDAAGSGEEPSIAVPVGAATNVPGFTLASSPASIPSPGANGTSTITVTPSGGFTGNLQFACLVVASPSNAGAPLFCSIPYTVAISGTTPVTVPLNVVSQATTGVGTYQVEVFASAPVDIPVMMETLGSFVSESSIIPVAVGGTAPTQAFALSNTPINIASPGTGGTSTITITPSGGFTGTVVLNCSVIGAVPGASGLPTCTVTAPAAITATAPVTATLSVSTQGATEEGTYAVTVTGVAGGVTAATNVPVTVAGPAPTPAFTLTGQTNMAVSIANPGGSGTSYIAITPSGGFTGAVALTCAVTGPANAVDLPTCSIAAPPVITGTAPVTAMLAVNTTLALNAPGDRMILRNPINRTFILGGGGAVVAFLFFGLPLRRRRTKTVLSLLLLVAFAATLMGCGGATATTTPAPPNPPANPGTTPGSYMVTVTGSSGALTASTTISVTVN